MGLVARLLGPTGGWKRRAFVLAMGIAAAGGIALAADKPDPRKLKPQPVAIEAQAITGFDKESAARTRFGRLEWLGGVVLTSKSAYFGGWSGLTVDAAGKRFAAVSDAGTWLTGELAYSGRRLAGVSATRIGPLLAQGGKPLSKGRDRDAEAMTLVDGTPGKGNLLVAFEGNDRIGRFAVDASGVAAPGGYLILPPELKKLRSVDGFEAISILRGGPLKGAVVALAEHVLPKETYHSGWIWAAGSSEPKRFAITGVGGFDVTDAAGLADGSLIVLQRRFRWLEGVKMRLTLLRAEDIKPGAKIEGEVLMEADLGQNIDNMEGLAVHAGPGGETILTLISDDNFNPLLQRTVLLQFALPAASVARRSE